MSDRIPIGFAEVHLHFRLTGDPEEMISSFGIQLAETADIAAVLSSIDLGAAELAPSITNQYEIGPHSVVVGAVEGDFEVVTTGDPVVGSGLGDATPQNTAYLARKLTFTPGRRGRGRMYIPGVPEGVVNGVGVVDSASLALLNAELAAMQALIQDTDNVVAFVLFHESAPFTPSTILGFQAQAMVATQRRRLRR